MGNTSAERTGQKQRREVGRWVEAFFSAPELFVWDALGFRGAQTRVFRDCIWVPGSQSFRYLRVLCSLWLLHSGCARTPHALLRCCLSCPVGQQCPGSAQPKGPGGAWLHLRTAAPLKVPFSLALQSAMQPLSRESPQKSLQRGFPGLCPQRRPPKAPSPRDIFPAFPKEGLGLMRLVSTQVLDNSTRRRLSAPPPSWDISKSLRPRELPRQLGGWRGTSRRDLSRAPRLDAGPHGDAFAEKEHPQRGFGDPLVPHTHHPAAGEGGPAGAQ